MFVKVCGVRNTEEINRAIEFGYSAIGIVVYPGSKRFVEKDKVFEMLKFARGKIETVVVSLYYKDVEHFINHTDYIQVYEKVDYKNLIFATDKEPGNFTDFKYLLYDASKGSGKFEKIPEWVKKYSDKLIIAGGLNCNNVFNVVSKFKPFGVDVSSGVEVNGMKNYEKMKEFIIKAVRSAECGVILNEK